LRVDPNYSWTVDENWNLAMRAFRALVSAARDGNQQIARAMAASILELYDKDRAETAHLRFGAMWPAPSLAIPQTKTVNGQNLVLKPSTLSSWTPDMPSDALNYTGFLVEALVPDELILAEYVVPYSEPLHPDPAIYARFGKWFFKIYEW
jgi:hypothetical protein